MRRSPLSVVPPSPTPSAGAEKSTGPHPDDLSRAAALAVNAQVHDELGTGATCDELSVTVERLRRDWAADFHGHTSTGWFLLLVSRAGRIAEDVERLHHGESPTTRRCAQEALLQLSAIAQILAQQLADETEASA